MHPSNTPPIERMSYVDYVSSLIDQGLKIQMHNAWLLTSPCYDPKEDKLLVHDIQIGPLDESLHKLPVSFRSSSTDKRAYLPILFNDYCARPPRRDRVAFTESQDLINKVYSFLNEEEERESFYLSSIGFQGWDEDRKPIIMRGRQAFDDERDFNVRMYYKYKHRIGS